jgi:ribosomal-protein-alanine N-acetyltransferase
MVEIETDRLHLRPFAATDVEALHRLWNDPEMRRFLWDDAAVTREQTAAQIELSRASFSDHGYGSWLLFARAHPTVVGFSGLRRFGEPPEVEVLYGIDSLQWGFGLATEAAAAVLRYAFETLALERVFAGADAPNAASFRVMEKLGMRFLRRVIEGDSEVAYYVVSRSAFRIPEGWYRATKLTS